MESEAVLLSFFACVKLLDILRGGDARIVWNGNGTEYLGLFIGTYNRVPYSEYHVTYNTPGTYKVHVGVNTMVESQHDLGVKPMAEMMQMARHWLVDKQLSDVCVRFDNRTTYRRFAKTFVCPLYSASMVELGLVSDVSVNPTHMRRDYRVPAAKAIPVANFMNRIDTLLDALQHLPVPAAAAHFYVGDIRVSFRNYTNPRTGEPIGQFVVSGGRRTSQRTRVSDFLKTKFDKNRIINFFCDSPRLHLDLHYTYPSYKSSQAYLADVLTPLSF